MNFPFFAAIFLAAASTPLISSAQVAQRDSGYKPFSITSSKLGKEMSSEQIERTIMCKVTTSVMAETMELLKNYDLLGSQKTADGSMSLTTFRGKQNGKAVPVVLMVDNSVSRLSWIMVDSQQALSCRY